MFETIEIKKLQEGISQRKERERKKEGRNESKNLKLTWGIP